MIFIIGKEEENSCYLTAGLYFPCLTKEFRICRRSKVYYSAMRGKVDSELFFMGFSTLLWHNTRLLSSSHCWFLHSILWSLVTSSDFIRLYQVMQKSAALKACFGKWVDTAGHAGVIYITVFSKNPLAFLLSPENEVMPFTHTNTVMPKSHLGAL